MHKRVLALALVLALMLCGCAAAPAGPEEDCIAATTYPVWQFTCAVTEGTPLTVERVISEPVSCVHDYTLSVDQMKILSRSRAVVTSGLGLEDFLLDVLPEDGCIDASEGIEALESDGHAHDEYDHDEHDHDAHDHDAHGHDHGEYDPHIWLDPSRAAQMIQNIARGLSALYPQYADIFAENAESCTARLNKLRLDGEALLRDLSCRELVTFHDGFSYFAEAFGLHIAAAMEVEAGSEPSAKELESIVRLLREENIPAVFSETSGSDATARIVAGETGAGVYALDLGMGERDYFSAMEHNLNTIREALK